VGLNIHRRFVIPAQAGIHWRCNAASRFIQHEGSQMVKPLDPGLRRDDKDRFLRSAVKRLRFMLNRVLRKLTNLGFAI